MKMRKGFTFVEILITLAITAVFFVPMMQLFSGAVYSVAISEEKVTAVNLARWEMERVKNLNITKTGLKKTGDLWIPELSEPPFEINNNKWRVLRRIKPESDPLEVSVEVYKSEDLKTPLASVVTLIEDNIWI